MRTMVAFIAASVVFATGVTVQNQVTQQSETATQIVRNERALYAAIAKGDKAAYQALVSPEGAWNTPTGVVAMGALADRLGAFELAKWGLESPEVAWLDSGAVVVSYVRSGGGRFGDRPFAPLMMATTAWTKRGSTWVATDHRESDAPYSSLIPEQAQWEITFAQVEAAAGLADLRSASADAVEARVMARPWSATAPVPFLRVVRRDGAVRAQLFEFWAPRVMAAEGRQTGKDIACRDGVCVRPRELKEQLDWQAVVDSVAHQDACGVRIGPSFACGDCEQAWIKSTAQGRYREQSCQLPDAGTSAATLLQFMGRSAGRGAP